MKFNWIIPFATMGVGVLGGYFAGLNGNASDRGSSDRQPATRTRSEVRPLSERGGRRQSRPVDISEIVRLPGGFSRHQSLMDYYGGLASHQFETEAAKLENLPAGERMLASYLLFTRWGETDPQAAMDYAASMGFGSMFVRPTVLQSWASVDPAGASKYYEENPREFAMMGMMRGRGGRGGMGFDTAPSIIATEWAKRDPDGALAWAREQGTSETISSVISQIASDDPERATEILTELPAEERKESYGPVARRYGEKDFQGAKAWIASLPPQNRDSALAAAISGLSNTDPNAAAKELAEMVPGDAKDRALESIVEDMARMDPQAAADLLKQQGTENSIRESMRDLMPTWAATDPEAALRFANSYEAGPVRDSAIQSYVWGQRDGPPEELVRLAESIHDEGDRYRTVGMAAMRWMREDEDAARAYIEQTSSLAEDAKQRILDGRGLWGGRRR